MVTHFIEEVRALNKFWSERMTRPVYSEVKGKSLGRRRSRRKRKRSRRKRKRRRRRRRKRGGY